MSEMSTHWEGCEDAHPECKAAKLEAENKRLREMLERCEEALHAEGTACPFCGDHDCELSALLRGEP